MSKIGYARVSTQDQTLDPQLDTLAKAGCERVFTDVTSGVKARRPGFDDLRQFLRPGDVLVVWKLDRLGRSTKQLIGLVDELTAQGVGLCSLTEQIDTTSASGTFFFQVLAAFAQMERSLVVERTNAGLAAARERGRKGGRPRKMTPKKISMARTLRDQGGLSERQIAEQLGLGKSTVNYWLNVGEPAAQQPA